MVKRKVKFNYFDVLSRCCNERIKKIGTIPDSLIKTNGLKIYTNLDLNAQTILEESINNLKIIRIFKLRQLWLNLVLGKLLLNWR